MRGSSLIPPQALDRVGTVITEQAGMVLRREWQRWAMAIGDTNPLWFDDEAARQAGYRKAVCPPPYLQYAVVEPVPLDALDTDGSAAADIGDLAFPAAPRRMAAGESATFHSPAYDRDEVTMTRILESLVEKHGRSGPFVLVTWLSTISVAGGGVLAEFRSVMAALP